MSTLAALLGFAAAAALAVLLVRARADLKSLQERFRPVSDLEAERARLQSELVTAKASLEEFLAKATESRADLVAEYGAAREQYDRLTAEIDLLDGRAEDLSFGLYTPHFDYQTAEQFKEAIEALRDREREMIRAGDAATCDTQWSVGGDRREGERMAKQTLKLILRAFNAECDAALANVRWDNVTRMEERVTKSFEALNKLGTVMQVSLNDAYLALKLDEIRLTHEHERKRQAEREEQRRIREQIREEERVQKELAKAQEEAEREESRFEKALERARAEATRAAGDQLEALQQQITTLEEQVREAHEKKERAISRAQMTRSGYVYVISNTGSFGEGTLKVGMTRRLDPYERIDELGDASVPFPFDVHAMLYSDDAPALERAIHDGLCDHRVNLINPRKEFFLCSLKQVEEFAKERGIEVEFTLIAEAKEYRESVALREKQAVRSAPNAPKGPPLPADLFPDRPPQRVEA